MCKLCNSYPCDPRCPNAPETKAVGYCEMCDAPIEKGDWCYELYTGSYYCEECIENTHKKISI